MEKLTWIISRTSLGFTLRILLLLLALLRTTAAQSDCTENLTRAHLTRCDKYFQCVVLPSKRIIWVSKQCDQGLIYDTDHGVCVLPSADWECELGDGFTEEGSAADEGISEEHFPTPDDQENVYNLKDYLGSNNDESSGEEESSNEVGTTTILTPLNDPGSSDEEFSGDGTETMHQTTSIPLTMVDASTEAVEMPITPDQDGTLKSYLQRLTQLIDGFRKNGGSTATEITPDQLNQFVVMHKIKSNKNYDPIGTHPLPENGAILKPHLEYILKKQYSLNTVENSRPTGMPTTTTTTTTTTPAPVRRRIIHIIRPYHHRPRPEDNTNINLSSHWSGIGLNNKTGYGSNSQIVVNRPEGSVLFNIARPAVKETIPGATIIHREPTISQDTLKSVLELSKQLVSHQKQFLNQKPNYLAPVVQPIYYTYPMPALPGYRPDYFRGEATPVDKDNSTTDGGKERPVKSNVSGNKKPTKIPGPNHGYNQPNKLTSEEDQSNQGYVQLPPVNPYQNQFPHAYYNEHQKKPYGYFTFPDDPHDHLHPYPLRPRPHPHGSEENFYQPESQEVNNNYYKPPHQNHHHHHHNSGHETYEPPHLPPYYDASGVGQSGENSYHQQIASSNELPHPIRPPKGNTNSEDHSNSDAYGYGGQDNQESQESIEQPTTKSPKPKPSSSPYSHLDLITQQLLLEGSGNKNKIVGINGNYMSFETYKETILPLLTGDQDQQSNVEVVTCSIAGVRHANSSDCTRYYVCNPKDGSVLGYVCPPYTAFNEMTRICDANSYAVCKPSLLETRFTILENKRLQYEAQKQLQEAKRIRDQAVIQAQFNRLQHEEDHQATTAAPIIRRPLLHKIQQKLKRKKRPNKRPTVSEAGVSSGTIGAKRKKRFKCTDAGQAIPDVLARHKYFLCFRDSQGQFKRRSMDCSAGLIFCSKRRMCTLKARC